CALRELDCDSLNNTGALVVFRSKNGIPERLTVAKRANYIASIEVVIQRRAYRIIELRCEARIPAEEIFGLPSDLRSVSVPAVALNASVSAPTFPIEFCARRRWL